MTPKEKPTPPTQFNNGYQWGKYEYDLAVYAEVGEKRGCPLCGKIKIKQTEDDIFCEAPCKKAFESVMKYYKLKF